MAIDMDHPNIYRDRVADLVDLDEVDYELQIRGVSGITSTSEKRKALRTIFASAQDPEESVEEAVIASLNPDLEYSKCSDKLGIIRMELQEYIEDEHIRRRSRARLLLLRLRSRRNACHDVFTGRRFDKIIEETEALESLCDAPLEEVTSLDQNLERLTLSDKRIQGSLLRGPEEGRINSEDRQESLNRRVDFRPNPLDPERSERNDNNEEMGAWGGHDPNGERNLSAANGFPQPPNSGRTTQILPSNISTSREATGDA